MTDSTSVALQRLADSLQIALLERSVQASTLTASWVGVAVGVLGALFAAIAIVTAIVLYRQTKEFHARAELMVASYREIVDKMAEEARLMAAAALEDVRLQATSVTEQLARTDSEQRSEREALEARRRQLDERIAALVAASFPSTKTSWRELTQSPSVSEIANEVVRQRAQAPKPPVPKWCPNCGWRQTALSDPRVMSNGLQTCPLCFTRLNS